MPLEEIKKTLTTAVLQFADFTNVLCNFANGVDDMLIFPQWTEGNDIYFYPYLEINPYLSYLNMFDTYLNVCLIEEVLNLVTPSKEVVRYWLHSFYSIIDMDNNYAKVSM